jgi:hypothetical protein
MGGRGGMGMGGMDGMGGGEEAVGSPSSGEVPPEADLHQEPVKSGRIVLVVAGGAVFLPRAHAPKYLEKWLQKAKDGHVWKKTVDHVERTGVTETLSLDCKNSRLKEAMGLPNFTRGMAIDLSSVYWAVKSHAGVCEVKGDDRELSNAIVAAFGKIADIITEAGAQRERVRRQLEAGDGRVKSAEAALQGFYDAFDILDENRKQGFAVRVTTRLAVHARCTGVEVGRRENGTVSEFHTGRASELLQLTSLRAMYSSGEYCWVKSSVRTRQLKGGAEANGVVEEGVGKKTKNGRRDISESKQYTEALGNAAVSLYESLAWEKFRVYSRKRRAASNDTTLGALSAVIQWAGKQILANTGFGGGTGGMVGAPTSASKAALESWLLKLGDLKTMTPIGMLRCPELLIAYYCHNLYDNRKFSANLVATRDAYKKLADFLDSHKFDPGSDHSAMEVTAWSKLNAHLAHLYEEDFSQAGVLSVSKRSGTVASRVPDIGDYVREVDKQERLVWAYLMALTCSGLSDEARRKLRETVAELLRQLVYVMLLWCHIGHLRPNDANRIQTAGKCIDKDCKTGERAVQANCCGGNHMELMRDGALVMVHFKNDKSKRSRGPYRHFMPPEMHAVALLWHAFRSDVVKDNEGNRFWIPSLTGTAENRSITYTAFRKARPGNDLPASSPSFMRKAGVGGHTVAADAILACVPPDDLIETGMNDEQERRMELMRMRETRRQGMKAEFIKMMASAGKTTTAMTGDGGAYNTSTFQGTAGTFMRAMRFYRHRVLGGHFRRPYEVPALLDRLKMFECTHPETNRATDLAALFREVNVSHRSQVAPAHFLNYLVIGDDPPRLTPHLSRAEAAAAKLPVELLYVAEALGLKSELSPKGSELEFEDKGRAVAVHANRYFGPLSVCSAGKNIPPGRYLKQGRAPKTRGFAFLSSGPRAPKAPKSPRESAAVTRKRKSPEATRAEQAEQPGEVKRRGPGRPRKVFKVCQ